LRRLSSLVVLPISGGPSLPAGMQTSGIQSSAEKPTIGGAQFTGGYADFRRTQFNGGYAEFEYDQFFRDVSFKDAKFSVPKSQEIACRIAKKKKEDQGNKDEADYYFYREMEAIRIQNGIQGTEKLTWPWKMQLSKWLKLIGSKIWRLGKYDLFEHIFIQGIFGYGVRPSNVAKAWLIVVFTLGVVYWIGSGVEKANNTLDWYEYFYFSVVTAATPGYAGYTPATGFYTLIAGAEAIFGTFMWAAFIATFARKWQR